MAQGRTISIRFRIDDDGNGFRRLTADAPLIEGGIQQRLKVCQRNFDRGWRIHTFK
ncbi:MAG: hypothetical protein K2J82_08780 [Muribaculaceae bacterium]|nr:hypothetical protein [Muribaculaceae bacterium]